MIRSGDYKLLLDLIKGFRNGFVYGCKVRAPHALLMTLLWSRGPIDEMAQKIFKAIRIHAMNLAKTAFTVKLVIGLLAKLQGAALPWHTAAAGAIAGGLFWSENNPVNVQVLLYLLSRVLSALAFVYMEKNQVKAPSNAFRIYAATIWAAIIFLFYNYPQTLQTSLASSMNYIYLESSKYDSLRNLLLVNSEKTI